MKKLTLILLLLLGGWFFPSTVRAYGLQYTLPAYNALVVPGVDPATGDSISTATCAADLANPISDLQYTRIYRYPYSGGGWVLHRIKSVIMRAGQTDTLDVPLGASYYVTTMDFSNLESCPSNIVHTPAVTGVPDDTIPAKFTLKVVIFDLQGRKVTSLKDASSGVYFRRYFWNDGSVTTRKFVHLK